MNVHEKMNYVELPAKNIEEVKEFFTSIFAWNFTDYGSEYTAFCDEGLDGGFYKSELTSTSENGSALIVFYSMDLEYTLEKIIRANGEIIKQIFEFPGGRRFHFLDPSGNEYAVWSEQKTKPIEK